MTDFDSLLTANLGWLRKAAHRFCRGEEAEDLAAECAYKLLKARDAFDESMAFKPWALAVMRNTWVSQARRAKMFADEAADAQSPYGAESLAEVGEIAQAIGRCASKSRCVNSAVLYAKGYSYEEIAEIEGVGIGTVKSRINAARKLIAKELAYS